MMLFIRRSKIKKLLAAYEKCYTQKIPVKSLAFQELWELRNLNLEEIATAYDLLDGFKHFPDMPCPAMSREWATCVALSKCTNKITRLRRLARHNLFVKKDVFRNYANFDPNRKLVNNSGGLWKTS